MPNSFEIFRNKTRALIFTTQPAVAKLVQKTLSFYDKDVDFFSPERSPETYTSDFIILPISEITDARAFEPNIVFISSEMNIGDLSELFPKITPGGVLIHHEEISAVVENSENFFKKMEFGDPKIRKSERSFVLQSDMGAIPLETGDELLIKNLVGIQYFTQQFGVMEEEFYEPLMNYQ